MFSGTSSLHRSVSRGVHHPDWQVTISDIIVIQRYSEYYKPGIYYIYNIYSLGISLNNVIFQPKDNVLLFCPHSAHLGLHCWWHRDIAKVFFNISLSLLLETFSSYPVFSRQPEGFSATALNDSAIKISWTPETREPISLTDHYQINVTYVTFLR